jgi:hypothetical protein
MMACFSVIALRNAQNYSRTLTALVAAASFVAGIGSVSAQSAAEKSPDDRAKPKDSKNPIDSTKPNGGAKPNGSTKPNGGAKPDGGAKPIEASRSDQKPSKAGSIIAKPSSSASAARKGPQRLIPPPPPSIPLSTLSSGGSSDIPANLQYLSKDELAKLHLKLKEQVTKTKTRFDDHEKRVKQQREKIVLYENLLQEGVVSRRDLENARNELDDLESRTVTLEEQVLQLTHDLTVVRKFLPAQKPQ